MRRRVVDSGSIVSVGYDEANETLQVEFWHGGIYRYLRVPRLTYERLLRAPSKGDLFNDEIRDKYASEKVI